MANYEKNSEYAPYKDQIISAYQKSEPQKGASSWYYEYPDARNKNNYNRAEFSTENSQTHKYIKTIERNSIPSNFRYNREQNYDINNQRESYGSRNINQNFDYYNYNAHRNKYNIQNNEANFSSYFNYYSKRELNIASINSSKSKRYNSIGLPNKGNTCFINSALQIIAHLPFDISFISDGIINSKLNNLILAMRRCDRYNMEVILSDFLNSLYYTSDFERHSQNDPKYLIIFLLKNTNLICSKREIAFCHDNHRVDIPDQKMYVFQIEESFSIDIKATFIDTINNKFLRCSNLIVDGYCNKCQINTRGREEVTYAKLAKCLIFSFTNQVACPNIKNIEFIEFGSKCYEIYSIVQRTGFSRSSGHVFVLCKEPQGWFQYNDIQKSNYSRNSVDGCYMFIYACLDS